MAERPDHEAVGPESFDEEALRGIEEAVEAGDASFEMRLSVEVAQHQEDDDAPEGFVEEGRMDILPIDQDGPREIGRRAVGFAVEEVAPASDGLRQCHGREQEVGDIENGKLLEMTEQDGREETEKKAAVDGEAALPDIEDAREVVAIEIEIEENIISASADDAEREDEKGEVQDGIRIEVMTGSSSAADENGQCGTAGDENAVPADVYTEEREGDSAR